LAGRRDVPGGVNTQPCQQAQAGIAHHLRTQGAYNRMHHLEPFTSQQHEVGPRGCFFALLEKQAARKSKTVRVKRASGEATSKCASYRHGGGIPHRPQAPVAGDGYGGCRDAGPVVFKGGYYALILPPRAVKPLHSSRRHSLALPPRYRWLFRSPGTISCWRAQAASLLRPYPPWLILA